MACFKPLHGYTRFDGGWMKNPPGPFSNIPVVPLVVPCGQCIGCRLNRSRMWGVRSLHESALYSKNSFLTLTFSHSNLPKYNSISVRDMQLFNKRLRKALPDVYMRMMYCGEYGTRTLRPHYHMCLFGEDFSADRRPYKKTPAGFQLWNSELLSSIWPYGHAVIGQLSFESAAYTARYILDKRTGDEADKVYTVRGVDGKPLRKEMVDLSTGEITEHNVKRVAEFAKMSNRPGIGYDWYQKYKSDVFPNDFVIIRGKPTSPPRYYYQILERENPDLAAEVKARRKAKREADPNFEFENSDERLYVRMRVQEARLKSLVRSLD